MITINTWRDPYDAGFTTTKPKQVSFQPGLTVLVGCNGAGKSTLLMNIKEEVAEQSFLVTLMITLLTVAIILALF